MKAHPKPWKQLVWPNNGDETNTLLHHHEHVASVATPCPYVYAGNYLYNRIKS